MSDILDPVFQATEAEHIAEVDQLRSQIANLQLDLEALRNQAQTADQTDVRQSSPPQSARPSGDATADASDQSIRVSTLSGSCPCCCSKTCIESTE